MDRAGQDDAARRIALASALVIALIAAAFGLTIWRYQHSHSSSAYALESRGDALRTQLLVSSFWQEREAMNEYLLNGDPSLPTEVRVVRTRFDNATADLGAGVQTELTLAVLARTANTA